MSIRQATGFVFSGRAAAVAVLIAALLAILCSHGTQAAPQGESVVGGSATFERSGATTTITAGNRAIINYSSFDIAASETVRFVQPSATATVLNRIQSASPTHIDGSLQANGIVYLVNRAGVIFGPGSVVNVGGLYAAASSISNQDFLAGINRFTDASGDVTNNGTIVADAVNLIGRTVANHGSIVATGGLVTMVAGKDVLLSEEVGGHLMVRLEGSAEKITDKPGVENTGTIQAPGGRVLLGAGDMFSLAARQAGNIQAEVVTVQVQAGKTEVTGNIDATGPTGGKVTVTGQTVVIDGATIDASGQFGGGEILIGGDYQGAFAGAPNAGLTFVGASSVLRADAIASGDGGKIIVWADGATGMFGTISARGGQAGGNGGFVEVSGKQWMVLKPTMIDLGAGAGAGGVLLLDPTTIELKAAAESGVTGFGDFTEAWAEDPGAAVFDVRAAGSFNAIPNGTTIVLQATGSITVTDAFNVATATGLSGAGTNLTLQAGGNITVSAGVTLVSGNLTLSANDNGGSSATGSGQVSITQAVVTGGGNFTAGGIAFSNSGSGTITTGGGAVDIANTGAVTIGAAINAGVGNVTIAGADSVFGGSMATGIAGAATITSSGTIKLESAGAIGSSGTPQALAATGTVQAQAVNAYIGNTGAMSLGASTVGGTFNVVSNTDLTVTGAISTLVASGPITLSAGTGTLTVSNTINSGTGAIVLIGDAMAIGAAVTTTTTLDVRPSTATTTIGLEDVSQTLSLTQAELTNLSAATLTIGVAGGTGSIISGDEAAVTLAHNTVLYGVSFQTKDFAITAGGNSLTINVDAIDLQQNLTANGGITIAPVTPATTIGISSGSGTLNLDATEVGKIISSGTVTIGSATAGAVTAGGSAAVSPAWNGVIIGASYTQSGNAVNFAAKSLTITADAITLSTNLTADGGITIAPVTPATTIGISSGSGTLNLDATEVGKIISSGTVTIGSATAGAVTAGGSAAVSPAWNAVIIGASYTQSGNAVGFGTKSLTITADAVAIGTDLTANGGLTIQPRAGATAIGIGAASGGMDLSAAELAFLNTSTTLTIGAAGGSGAVTIGASAMSTEDWAGLTIRGGAVTFTGLLTLPSGATATFNTGGITESVVGSALTIAGTGTAIFNTSGGVTMDTAIDRLGASTVAGTLSLTNDTNLTVTGAISTVAASGPITLSAGTGLLSVGAGNTVNAGAGTVSLTGVGVTVGAAVTGTGGITINTGTGTLTVSSTVNAGGSLAHLIGDLMVINASVTGGGITVEPATAGQSIGLVGAGTLNLSEAELGNLNTAGTLTIGAVGGSGAVTISNAVMTGESWGGFVLNGGTTAFTGPLMLPGNCHATFNTAAITELTTDALTIWGGDGTVSFNTTGSVTMDLEVNKLGASSVNGTLTLVNDVLNIAGLEVSGAVSTTAGQSISISAKTGFLTVTGTIDAGAGSATLTANTMAINNTVTGNGGITVQPSTASRAIGIGGTPGGMDLSLAELGNLTSTGTVIIGASGGSGAVNVGGDGAVGLGGRTWAGMTIRGGAVTFNNTLTLPDGSTATITGTNVAGAASPGLVIGGAGTLVLSTTNTTATTLVTAIGVLGNTGTNSALTITNDTSLNVTGTVASASHAISISAGAGTLTVGNTINAGTSTVSLTGGPMDINAGITGGGGVTLTGSAITIGAAVASSNAIAIDASGTLDINNTITTVATAAGVVCINAGGYVHQNASGIITAGSLGIKAAGEIVLAQTNHIGTFAAQSTLANAAIQLTDDSTLVIGTVTDATPAIWGGPLVGVTTITGNVTIVTGGDLTLTSPIAAAGATVHLETMTSNADILSGAGPVDVTANSLVLVTVGVSGNVGKSSPNNPLLFDGASYDVSGVYDNGLPATGPPAYVYLTHLNAPIVITPVNDGVGNGTVSEFFYSTSGTGTITINCAGLTTVTLDDNVEMEAVNGIIEFTNAAGVAVTINDARLQTTGSGNISISSSALTIIEGATGIAVPSPLISAGGSVIINTNTFAMSAGTIEGGAGNTVGGVSITTSPGNDLQINGGTITASGSGALALHAGQHFVLNGASITSTPSGPIQISATNNVTLTAGTVNSSGTGQVQVTAGGIITDSADDTPRLIGTDLLLDAVNGVGANSGNALNTQVDNLAVRNTMAGGIYVANAGPLAIGGAVGTPLVLGGNSVSSGLSAADSFIRASSPLAINAAAVLGGSFTFQAGNGAVPPNDDLTINADVTLTSDVASTLAFVAGDNILHTSGTVRTELTSTALAHTVSLWADRDGAADGVRGGITQSGGAIRTGTLVFSADQAVTLALLNHADVIAGLVTGAAQAIIYNDTGSTSVGAGTIPDLGPIAGITGQDSVTITTAAAGALDINGPITTTTGAAGIVRMDIGGYVHQNGSGIVTGDSLGIRAVGEIVLTQANAVDVFAAESTLLNAIVRFTDTGTLSIGTVTDAVQPVWTYDLVGVTTSTGNATIGTVGDLTVTDAITTTGGAVDLQNTGAATVGAAIDAGAGNVTIAGADSDFGGSMATSIGGIGTITSSGTIKLESAGAVGLVGTPQALAATGTVRAQAGTNAYISNTGAMSLGASTAGGTLTVASDSGLTVSGNLTAAGVDLTAGATTGVGNLGFSGAFAVSADTISLRAGDGEGGAVAAAIDAATNAPTFQNTAGNAGPTTFTIRQDAAITDAALPAGAQFTWGPPTTYNLRSDDGAAVTINTSSKIAGSAVVITGSSAGDAITVNGSAATQTGSITVNGGDGDDVFTVSLASGLFLPSGGVFLNGDGQVAGDSITLTGGSPTTVTYTFTNANSGTIAIANSTPVTTGTITYTGLEPITDTTAAANHVFTFTNAADVIVVANAGVADDGMSQISSGASETVTFTNPTISLTINTLGGGDSITVVPDTSGGVFDKQVNVVSTGNLAIGAAGIDVDAGVTIDAGGTLDINGPITTTTAAAGIVRIDAGGYVHQNAAGIVTADSLGVRAADEVVLTQANVIDTFAASATAGPVTITNAGTLSIGIVSDATPAIWGVSQVGITTVGQDIGITSNTDSVIILRDLTADNGVGAAGDITITVLGSGGLRNTAEQLLLPPLQQAKYWHPDAVIIFGNGAAGDITVSARGSTPANGGTIRLGGNVDAVPGIATIWGKIASGNLTEFLAKEFIMGQNSKFSSTGSTHVYADNATVGDMAAVGSLEVLDHTSVGPSNITYLRRAAGDGLSNLVRSKPDNSFLGVFFDEGMEFVAGGSLNMPGAGTLGGTGVLDPVGTGAPGSTFRSGPALLLIGAVANMNFDEDMATPGVRLAPDGTELWILGAAQRGVPATSNLATALASALPSQQVQVSLGQSVDASQQEDLVRHLVIYTRSSTVEELLDYLCGRKFHNDAPKSKYPLSAGDFFGAALSPSDNKVSIDRLPGDLASEALAKYREVYWRQVDDPKTGKKIWKSVTGDLRKAIEKSVEEFKAQNNGKFDPVAYRKWVASSADQKEAADLMAQLESLFHTIERLGLGPVEQGISLQGLAGYVKPRGLSLQETISMILNVPVGAGEPVGEEPVTAAR